MSPSGKVLYRIGDYGTTVKVVDRGVGSFVLRFTNLEGKLTDKALKHRDERRAKQQARELSRELANLRASESGAPGARAAMTVRELFARYTVKVSAHKKGQQPKEDARRRTLWLAVLGPDTLASKVTKAHVREFTAKRLAGNIVIDGLNLAKTVKPRTAEADIVWLQSVYNWAVEAELLERNPIKGAPMPQVISQLRPMATADRVAMLEAIAGTVHPRFPLLLACVRYLGWRISAVCALTGKDFDRRKTPQAPHGLVHKDAANDKEGVGAWLPMPKPLRAALDAARVVGRGPVFPAPTDSKKAMSRFYARELLERAEKAAKLAPIEGGDWHPYRRLWATERKALPTGDVMLAGGWQDERTLRKYQLADPATLKAVMLFDPTATTTETQTPSESGATPGTPKAKTTRHGGRVSA